MISRLASLSAPSNSNQAATQCASSWTETLGVNKDTPVARVFVSLVNVFFHYPKCLFY